MQTLDKALDRRLLAHVEGLKDHTAGFLSETFPGGYIEIAHGVREGIE